MNKVLDYYSQFDEWGRLEREPLEFTVNWHYMKQFLPHAGKVLDNGAGPGKYTMELARHNYEVTLTDLTPQLVGIAKDKANELGLADRIAGFHVRNAVHLHGLPDDGYDAALMMGPLYHLQQERDREAAVTELRRVTKQGGVVFVAFQTRMRMLLTSLASPQQWKPNDTLDAIERFMEDGVFDHQDPGRFTGAYYCEVEKIKPMMERFGFETLELIGSSNIGALLSSEQKQYWVDRGEEDRLTELLIRLARDPSVLGVSSHLLYIGRKR